MNDVELWEGDCLELLRNIPNNSIDMILADLPYGTTRNNWDFVIPMDLLWLEYDRIGKPTTPVILFGQDKFSARLMLSNEKFHRYNLIWKKGNRISGFLNSNRMPLRNHEDILVFYRRLPTYNPQFTEGKALHSKGKKYRMSTQTNNNYGKFEQIDDFRAGSTQKYPISVLDFDKPHPAEHPTQKPIPLLEWLIRTYSNSGDLVLDNVMGIGSTGIAAVNLGRKFIGIEKNPKYFEIAKNKITRKQDGLEVNMSADSQDS